MSNQNEKLPMAFLLNYTASDAQHGGAEEGALLVSWPILCPHKDC